MNCLRCYDSDGNSIRYFTQWDQNQEIIIEGDFSSDSIEVHFCNENSEQSLYMESTFINDYQIKSEIPNELLMQPYPICIYVYAVNNISTDDLTMIKAGKTVLSTTIPVKARKKPSDFVFEENTYVIYLANLEKEILDLNKSISNSEQVRTANESIRINNEETRESNESQRISNENNRQNTIATCQTATENAITAANKANIAATAAENAVNNVNTIILNIGNESITFQKASTAEDITSGETFNILFGKISKWYDEISLLKQNVSDVVTSEDIDNLFSS